MDGDGALPVINGLLRGKKSGFESYSLCFNIDPPALLSSEARVKGSASRNNRGQRKRERDKRGALRKVMNERSSTAGTRAAGSWDICAKLTGSSGAADFLILHSADKLVRLEMVSVQYI